MAAARELLQLHLPKIRTPLDGEKIYKDECAFCFDTPESADGLYVCMNTFLGFGKDHVKWHYKKTGNAVYMHLRRIKQEIPQEKQNGPEKKVTKLAIGLEGGFQLDAGKKYEYEDYNSIVVLPEFVEILLSRPDIPEQVQISASSILAADSANKVEELQALAGTWDGEKRRMTKHADKLVQLDTGVQVPPKGWKCARCDMVDNLWLNLTDGSILCGRKFFDGSGGNSHAVEHYQTTGYPLAVKLGTITPEGKADLYSYDEDDMVEDPHLVKHLAHFGINIAQMQKTDKSMIELEIDMNQRIGEWATIQEAGSQLKPVYGPGYTGLANLGNSCYLNSVVQVIFTIPDFNNRFVTEAESIFQSASSDPASDFNVQMAKLGLGLGSGKYSIPPPEGSDAEKDANESQPGVRPTMFKNLIGRGHPDFSTKRQQDAQDFLLHLINVLERNSRHQANPAECFKFKVEERFQCSVSGKVKYTHRTEYYLPLPICLETATNKGEVAAYDTRKAEAEAQKQRLEPEQIVRPRIALSGCITEFSKSETVEQFYSTALGEKTVAYKTTRLATFPDYLIIQLKKFTVGNDWVPKKLDVSVDVPDNLDLTALRGHGLQSGEEELPELQGQSPAIEIDESVVAQLMDMGFPPEACRKAVFFTDNSGAEAALNWVMEHMGDADFAELLVPPGTTPKPGASGFEASEEALGMIMSMGFSREQAKLSLEATENNVERAVDWIFSHQEELESDMDTSEPPQPVYRDGKGEYRLKAFISHMGTSTMVGHYVCHIFKDGHWVIFNDNKVALSENPPRDLAYIYLYERV